jgi:hypothetical protein
MTTNTTFIINGGAGRVVAAIPALEKFHRLNPNNDFRVLVYGWENLYWGHPLLQDRTFSVGQKGVFAQHMVNNTVVSPEPYWVSGYYNQRMSLAQAFDHCINQTDDHDDLGPPTLRTSTLERAAAVNYLSQLRREKNRNRVVVIQPYGSGINMVHGRPWDSSHRSLDVEDYLALVKQLEKINQDLLIVYFGPREFMHPADSVSVFPNLPGADLRLYMSLIEQCDLFVGCDSVGQHMARALSKPGVVVMGSTFEVNVSYPDYFKFYRNRNQRPVYSPIRLSGVDCEFADRSNDGILKFSKYQIDELADLINRQLYP